MTHGLPLFTHIFLLYPPQLHYHPSFSWHMTDYGSLAKWTSEPSWGTKVWLISKAPLFCHYPTVVTYIHIYDTSA
jgi:hypothetical protein